MQTPPALPPPVRWILWFALAGSVVAYFCLIHFRVLKPSEPGAGANLAGPALILGAVLGLAGILVRLPAIRLSRVPEAGGKVNALFIVSLALSEAPGILGFVLGILGQGATDYLPLFAISAFAFLSNRPAAFFPRDEDA
jgi:F0F1-type ATP synthase membrane subunit c/vacuolar-type H+-ATPase subunit K